MEAYKVGVTFALNNTISPELLKITAQLGLANDAAKALNATLRGLDIGATGAVAVSAGAKAMGDSFKYASAEIDGVKVKLAGLKAEAARMGGASSGGSGKGWASGIGSFLMSPTGFVGEYGVFEMAKQGLAMQDAIARSMVAMGMQVGPDYMSSGVAGNLRSSIFSTATRWGVGVGDTEEASLQAMRSLAPLSPEQRMKLLPSLMNFAGAEVFSKHGTTMLEATEAAIGLAHQMRAYSPEQIEPLLGSFAKLSMASPQSLSQMSRASSYYLPLLTAGLGMDSTELMAMGTVGSQMGLNSKAGTWLARMFQAPFVADLTGSRGSKRKTALEELGIVHNGKVVTKDAFEFLRILEANSSKMTPERRTLDYVAAFGQEGARAAAIFTDPAVMQNLLALAAGLKSAPSPNKIKESADNDPLMKFHQSEAALSQAFTSLGEALMPATTGGIKLLTDSVLVLTPPLKGIADLLSGLANLLGPILGVAKAVLGTSGMGIGATGTFFGDLLQGKGVGRSFSAAMDVVNSSQAGSLVGPVSGYNAPIEVTHVTQLDGQVLAKSTSSIFGDYLQKSFSSASGPRSFDPRQSLAPAGGN